MRRVPILPTILVALAAAAMIGLGIWQLHRRLEKEALLTLYASNLRLPETALPAFGSADGKLLYRRVSAFCLQPTAWKAQSGRGSNGASGWRHIALCRTGVEGPGFAADVGVSQASADPAWRGGPVTGRLIWMPGGATFLESFVARLMGKPEPSPTPMIVAEIPAPALKASAQPDPNDIPNNHLAYAVQWFIFAALAVVIYIIALVRRGATR